MKMGNSTHISPRASVVMDSSVEYSRIVTPQEKCIYYVLDSSGNVETTWYNGHELSQGDIFSFAGSPKYEKPKYDDGEGTLEKLVCIDWYYYSNHIMVERDAPKQIPFYCSPSNSDLSGLTVKIMDPANFDAALEGISIDDRLFITANSKSSAPTYNIGISSDDVHFVWTGDIFVLNDEISRKIEITQLTASFDLSYPAISFDCSVSVNGSVASSVEMEDETFSLLTLESSNPSVVNVVNGSFYNVYPVSSGTATLTAKTKYASKSCEVTIPQINDFSEGTIMSISQLGEPVTEIIIYYQETVNAEVMFGKYSNDFYPKIEWTSSDESVFKIYNDPSTYPNADTDPMTRVMLQAIGEIGATATITAKCKNLQASATVVIDDGVAH